MNKTSVRLITGKDGFPVLNGGIFPESHLNKDSLLQILTEAGWSGERGKIELKLSEFDRWYTFRLREMNGPSPATVKRTAQALAVSLTNLCSRIEKLDRDMKISILLKLRQQRSTLKLKDLEALKASAKAFGAAFKVIIAEKEEISKGRPKTSYRTEAAQKLISCWEEVLEKKFPRTFETVGEIGLNNPNGELYFKAPSMRFMFEILKSFEPPLTIHDARHAVERISNQKTQPK